LQVVSKQLSVAEAAAEYGYSRRHLHRLLVRYRQGGLDALAPRSRRPRSSPHQTPEVVRDRIIELRRQLTAAGSDAGPVTIAWHLAREGLGEPSTSTIRRILHGQGLVLPQPRKRPRSSYVRFQAAQPNEMWQSDVTHWQLADGTDVGSSTGSTTTPDTCSQRPLTSPSPATTWSRCSCRPSTNTARRPAP
jgi:transposase